MIDRVKIDPLDFNLGSIWKLGKEMKKKEKKIMKQKMRGKIELEFKIFRLFF